MTTAGIAAGAAGGIMAIETGAARGTMIVSTGGIETWVQSEVRARG